jgi:hypothetical protein
MSMLSGQEDAFYYDKNNSGSWYVTSSRNLSKRSHPETMEFFALPSHRIQNQTTILHVHPLALLNIPRRISYIGEIFGSNSQCPKSFRFLSCRQAGCLLFDYDNSRSYWGSKMFF